MSPDSVQQLQEKLVALRAALSTTADMRPGSLLQRYTRCGKPTCHCAREGDPGHGPIWSLTHEVAGKTITKSIPSAALDSTRAQIAEYKRFRVLVRELVQLSERLCDARLAQTEGASQQEAKKGASKKPSQQRSARKSRPS